MKTKIFFILLWLSAVFGSSAQLVPQFYAATNFFATAPGGQALTNGINIQTWPNTSGVGVLGGGFSLGPVQSLLPTNGTNWFYLAPGFYRMTWVNLPYGVTFPVLPQPGDLTNISLEVGAGGSGAGVFWGTNNFQYQVVVDANDTTPGTLSSKIAAGIGGFMSTNNVNGNEVLVFNFPTNISTLLSSISFTNGAMVYSLNQNGFTVANTNGGIFFVGTNCDLFETNRSGGLVHFGTNYWSLVTSAATSLLLSNGMFNVNASETVGNLTVATNITIGSAQFISGTGAIVFTNATQANINSIFAQVSTTVYTNTVFAFSVVSNGNWNYLNSAGQTMWSLAGTGNLVPIGSPWTVGPQGFGTAPGSGPVTSISGTMQFGGQIGMTNLTASGNFSGSFTGAGTISNAGFSTIAAISTNAVNAANATNFNGNPVGLFMTNSTSSFLVPTNYYWWASQGGEGLNLSGTGIGAIRLLSSATATNWTIADNGLPIYIDPNYAATNVGAPYTRQITPLQIGNRIIGIAQQTANTNGPGFRVLCSYDCTNIFSLGVVYPFGAGVPGTIYQPYLFADLTGTNYFITIPWQPSGATGLQCYLSHALDATFTNWSSPTLIFGTMPNGYDFDIIANASSNNYQMYYNTNGNNVCSALAFTLTGTWTPWRSSITTMEAPRVFQISTNLWYLFADSGVGSISALKSVNQGLNWSATVFTAQSVPQGPFFPGGMFQVTTPLVNTSTMTVTNPSTLNFAAANFNLPNGSISDNGESVNGFLFASRGMIGQMGILSGSIYLPGSITAGGTLSLSGSFSSDGGNISSSSGSLSIQNNLNVKGSESVTSTSTSGSFVTQPTYNPFTIYISGSVESNVNGIYIYNLTNSAAGYTILTNTTPSTNVIFWSSTLGILLAPTNVAYDGTSAPELSFDLGMVPQTLGDNWFWPDQHVFATPATNTPVIITGTMMNATTISGTNFNGGTFTVASNAWNLAAVTNSVPNFSTTFASSNGIPVAVYSSNGVAYVYYLTPAAGGILP